MFLQALRRRHGLMRHAGTAALIVLTAALPARADDQRAVLDLVVNEVAAGEAIVLLRGADVLLPVEALERAGLRGFAGVRETVDGHTYVSLTSLAPRVSFQFDQPSFTVRIAAIPEVFAPTLLNLHNGAPADTVYRHDTSGFFNYAANFEAGGGYSLFGEAGVSSHGALALTTLSRNGNGPVIRGLSSVTVDDRQRMMRWVVGDNFGHAGTLGGGALLLGVHVTREYGLDPYFLRFPSVGLSAAATTPSTVEVYVNDQLVRSEQVPAGQFELRNLPTPNGSGEATIVVRDVFGREQAISSRFYVTTAVLARGLHEYSYSLGYPRAQLGISNWDYGKLMFLGRHRYGLTNAVTAGMRLEASGDLISGGPSLTLRTPVGELELALGASRAGGVTGSALGLIFARTARRLSLGAGVSVLGRGYSTTTADPSRDSQRLEGSAFASFQVAGTASVSLQHTMVQGRQPGTDVQRTALTAHRPFTRHASLSLTAASARRDHHRSAEAAIGLAILMGARTAGSVSYERDADDRVTGVAQLQRSLPVGNGYGYRVQVQDAEQNVMDARAQYQGPFGRYELIQGRLGGANATSATVAGGLVGIGGRLYATRAVQESFALVRVPGVGGVRAYASNQEIGRTDRHGDLLVPNLLPYYGNRLAIDEVDIPLTYRIGASARTIAPPYRGGAMVTFPVAPIRTVRGKATIELAGRSLAPAFGEASITARGETYSSPLGGDGEFYFENVPAGRRAMSVEFRSQRWTCMLDVPEKGAAQVDVGTLACIRQ